MVSMLKENVINEIREVIKELEEVIRVVESIEKDEFAPSDVWNTCKRLGYGDYECVLIMKRVFWVTDVFGRGGRPLGINYYDISDYSSLSEMFEDFFGVKVNYKAVYNEWSTEGINVLLANIMAELAVKNGVDPLRFLDVCVKWFDEFNCIELFERVKDRWERREEKGA